MNGKTETNESESFVDIFQLGTDFDGDAGAVTEVTQEVVTEGTGDVTDVTKQEEAKTETSVASTEEESSTVVVEKQDEIEEVSKEDASTKDDNPASNTGVEDLMQTMADDGVLLFDEESEYEPTAKGMSDLISQTVQKKSDERFAEMKSSLPEEASKLLDVLEKGGSIEDYNALSNQIDFNEVDASNEQNQGYLVEDWMKLQGYTAVEIRERIEDLRSANLLAKEANMAKTKLAKNQEQTSAKRLADIEVKTTEDKATAAKNAEDFKTKVTSMREVAGFSLTQKKAEKLYEFITNPDKEGKTGFQKADTEENRMLYAMMAMDGFDKEKLSKQEASKQTIKLKKKLNNFQDTNTAPRGTQIRQDKPESDGVQIPWSM
tara:strand:+ start:356 stop:1483 length:1128 start_codon:yes stop_codon:yes gene_type:complete